MTCMECEEEATWLRVTQFAGSHPYCFSCAQKETDWMEEDSYMFWRKID